MFSRASASRLATLLLTLAILLPGAMARAAEDRAELRKTLFAAANGALARANEARANLLAPQGYQEGAENYQRAQGIFDSGGGLDAIQRNLDRAQSLFATAAQHATTARNTFQTLLEARSDAESSEAARYAEELWRDAEETFADAALKLERGRGQSAARDGERAEALYREAELAAIKANYLNETRSLLEIAEDQRARRYAPISYQRARELLAEAEQALTENRYDTDRPRNLAQLAEHNAHHAIYVARLESRIRSNETTLEQILLDWEGAIATVADQLDVPVYFDAGHKDAVEKINQSLATLKSDVDFLRQAVADRDAQIASLEIEVGGQTESLERVNAVLAQRERQRERFERVERLFSPEQATVLRQADSLILRLIGLNFASGSARLTDDHEAILSGVRQTIEAFPEANIVIEGHTDSFGSDASNQSLSQGRADAVLQYLLANAPVSPANVTALGYGESRPVANNETPEGRARNRRIDIVIYPKW